MVAVQDFIGRWVLVSSENWEEYMKEAGVGLVTRKAAAHLKPTLEIKLEGDIWHFNFYSTFKNSKCAAKLDEPFDETTPDGRSMHSVMTFADGKFVHNQKKVKSSDKDSVIVYSLEGGKVVTTLQCGSVNCRREYAKE